MAGLHAENQTGSGPTKYKAGVTFSHYVQ